MRSTDMSGGYEMMVLLVEDDAVLRPLIRSTLEQQDITVTEAVTVAEARHALDGPTFDVVILDLTLPDGSGLEVLAHLRAKLPDSHVIVLSGAISEADRVQGLQLGADDYVGKPFSTKELTARVLAVRRRREGPDATTVRFGHVELDLAGRRLLIDGGIVEIATVEFSLLSFLATRPGRAFSRGELLTEVWKSDADWQSLSTVTEHVRRVRNKIEADPHHPVLLRTIRGVGYRFDLPATS